MSEIPTHLRHKPVVITEKYETIDGKYANNTDVQGLSIGLAQYDDRGKEISAKIWRQSDKRWSRQSEEMPLHRVLDLAILLCSTQLSQDNKGNIQNQVLNENQIQDNEKMVLAFHNGNEHLKEDIGRVQQYLKSESDKLKPRYRILARLLKQMDDI